MELGLQEQAVRKLGYGIAAVSYDSPAVLDHFAARKGIKYPLLSDPESKLIDAFGIRNENVKDGFAKGVPHPALFLIGADGRVEGKYMESDFRERVTISSILTGRFGERAEAGLQTIERPRVKVLTSSSATLVRGGQHVRLQLEAQLGEGLHVYAPGAGPDFIPLRWTLQANPAFKAGEVEWPTPERVQLFGSAERVPSYRGTVRASAEVTLASQQVVEKLATGGEIAVTGAFRLQACTDKLCYPPETVPVSWKLVLEGHDRERVPAELQRK